MTSPSHSFPLAAAFFKPLLELSTPAHLDRTCHGIEDSEWLLIGGCWKYQGFESSNLRCAAIPASSAATPAAAPSSTPSNECPLARTPARSSFFDALASLRRLQHLQAVNEALARLMTRTMDDPFASFGELDSYELFGGDGHWHAAAAHDPRDAKGTKHATGHVYHINLRTQAIRHLDLCDPIFKRKEHDISVIKRATWDALRGGTPKGRPVILVWDRAIIDYGYLQKAKDQQPPFPRPPVRLGRA